MPTLKRLAELQKHLLKLGNERDVVTQWGESLYIPELPAPAAIDEGKPSALDAGKYSVAPEAFSEEALSEEPSIESILDAPPSSDDYTSFLQNMDLDNLGISDEIQEPGTSGDDDMAKLLSSFSEQDFGGSPGETEPAEASEDTSAGQDALSGFDTSFIDTGLPDLARLDAGMAEGQDTAGTADSQDLSGLLEATAGEDVSENSVSGLGTDLSDFTSGNDDTFSMPDLPDMSSLSGDLTDNLTDATTQADADDSFAIPDFPSMDSDASGTESFMDAGMPDADSAFSSSEAGEPEISDSSLGGISSGFESMTPEEVPEIGRDASEIQDTPEDIGFPSSDTTSDVDDISALPSMDDIHDMESLSFGDTGAGATGIENASEESIAVPDIGTDSFHAPDALDQELASLQSGTLEPENFSLDTNWDEGFSIPGFEPKKKESERAPAQDYRRPEPEQFGSGGDSESDIELTESQVDELQETLLTYPLNVRLCIEDILANNHGTLKHQKELVGLLVDGASAFEAAKLAGRILRRPIEVPQGYDKRRGAAFEEEKNSFRYIFVHSILPVLQVLVLAALGIGLLGFIGYNFVYRPLHSNSLYSRGYKEISAEKYPESVSLFQRANKEWIMRSWFYRYADRYIEKKQYGLAEQVYRLLLINWPKDIKGALDYARLQAEILYDFAAAEKTIQKYILQWKYFHKEAMLFLARNYLNWADYLEQQYKPPEPSVLEDIYKRARLQLASLMEQYGRTDEYLELMLLYLIRSERVSGNKNLKDIAPFAKYYLGNKKSKFAATTLSELANYLMDNDIKDNVQDILTKAVKNEPLVPEGHSAIARWFRIAMLKDKEVAALQNAQYAYEKLGKELSNKQIKQYLRDLIRLSELYIAEGRSLDTMELLTKGISLYELSLEELRFPKAAEFGKAYALLGDVYFYKPENFEAALTLYGKAESNGYLTPVMDYHRGYIYYTKDSLEDYGTALSYFYRASIDSKPTPYLLMALGNTLYKRGDFFAAQSYYKSLVTRLQTELDLIPNPSPQERPSHEEIVRLLVAARNNLGSAYLRVANQMGDSSKRASAMAEFTESARLFDSLSRDQKTMIRSDAKNYGFLNLDFVLHPKRDIDIMLDEGIKPDMNFPR